MSARTPIFALSLAVASALVLSGCVPGEPDPTSSPKPSASPVFESEEEALAAAAAAYRAYLATSDLILSEGGVEPNRIDDVAVGAAASDARSAFEAFASKGYKSVGSTSFDNLALQQFSPSASRGDEVLSAYLCEDVSHVDVVNSDGFSVVSAERPPKQAYEVAFEELSKANQLVLSRANAWEGPGVCTN